MLAEEVKKKLEIEMMDSEFFKGLEDEVYGFKLNKIFQEIDSTYEYFSYANDTNHRRIKIYFHSDTKEYRLLVSFGLNEFCLTEFITDNIKAFTDKLQTDLENILKSISEFEGVTNIFVEQKKISTWQYGKELPTNLEGFELFINPSEILEITNGSFVIINYCDFSINSDLAIYYNIFSDDFGSEARINGAPTVIYDFDSTNLKELEEKLRLNLGSQLQNIRKSA